MPSRRSVLVHALTTVSASVAAGFLPLAQAAASRGTLQPYESDAQFMLSWGLFRDPADPARYIEHFVDESWVEHLRHFERMSAFDLSLRERRLAFHVGDKPPVVHRLIAQALDH